MSLIAILVVALVAIFSSITAPLILQHRIEAMHREDLKAQFEREDEVAAKASQAANALLAHQQEQAALAAEVAKRLQEAQAETIRRTNEVASVAAKNANRVDKKLNQIHVLVNSEMTDARQGELDQTRAVLAGLRRVIALSKEKGIEPDPEDEEAVLRTVQRIADLETTLATRAVQLQIAAVAAQSDAEDGNPEAVALAALISEAIERAARHPAAKAQVEEKEAPE